MLSLHLSLSTNAYLYLRSSAMPDGELILGKSYFDWKKQQKKYSRIVYKNPLNRVQIGYLKFKEAYDTDTANLLFASRANSGKTRLLEWQIARVPKNRCTVYLAPTKALVEQKAVDWRKLFTKNTTASSVWNATAVQVRTGDYNPTADETSVFEKARLKCMTPEAFDAAVCNNKKWLQNVDLLCVDEVHTIGDITRGHVLESAIMTFFNIIVPTIKKKDASRCPRLVAASATFPNIKFFCD